jgi:hypothetical protein
MAHSRVVSRVDAGCASPVGAVRSRDSRLSSWLGAEVKGDGAWGKSLNSRLCVRSGVGRSRR